MNDNSVGSSFYHSLNARAQRRFSHGVSMIGSFMWSKMIDQTTWLNATDLSPEHRISPFFRPMRFSVASTYDIPVGRGKSVNVQNRFLNAVVGGWLIAGGVGITPMMSTVRSLTDRCWPGEIYLMFSVRALSDIAFRDELDYLQARFPNLHVRVTLTGDPDCVWAGARGKIIVAGGRKPAHKPTYAVQQKNHSITSSASNWIELGTSIPSARAVCTLMTNSNLVDCTTGRSAGFSPLRMRPV
jgi:hypothetical protein